MNRDLNAYYSPRSQRWQFTVCHQVRLGRRSLSFPLDSSRACDTETLSKPVLFGTETWTECEEKTFPFKTDFDFVSATARHLVAKRTACFQSARSTSGVRTSVSKQLMTRYRKSLSVISDVKCSIALVIHRSALLALFNVLCLARVFEPPFDRIAAIMSGAKDYQLASVSKILRLFRVRLTRSLGLVQSAQEVSCTIALLDSTRVLCFVCNFQCSFLECLSSI